MGFREILGLTVIAAGTSLPGLATALVAAYRRHPDVVLGNVIGSNLFNTLGILGVTSMIVPLPITGRVADTDVWIMLMVAIAVSPVLWTGRVISRVEGAMFLALYLVYMFWVWTVGSP
jgi:cation:H+ antiporter